MSSINEPITIVVDEKLCKHHQNGLCMKTAGRIYGPWPCIPGKCNFSPYSMENFFRNMKVRAKNEV